MSVADLRVWLVDPSLFTAPYDAALSKGLTAAGVAPRWYVRPYRDGEAQLLERAEVDDCFYRRVDGLVGLPGIVRAMLKGGAHLLGLLYLLRQGLSRRPDAIHFQWTVLPPIDSLAIALLSTICPVVLTVHDTVPHNGERASLLQRLAFDLPLGFADRVIVHTRSGRDALIARKIAKEKIVVVPHGPLSLAEPAGPTVAAPDSEGRLTFVLFGEIKHYKGVDLLIEAVAKLPPELRQRARFIVAGRPRMSMEPLVARIQQLGLADTLEIRPKRLHESEMASLFQSADCFVFPYRQIDASGVYFLVKGYSAWIIASSVGIFAEDVLDHVDGSLVPVGDVDALSAAIAATIRNRPRARRASAADAWARIGVLTREVYESCAAPSRDLKTTVKADGFAREQNSEVLKGATPHATEIG